MQGLATTITTTWLIYGDFNVVIYPQDKLLGNPITYAETQDFTNCIQVLQISELSWKCDYYTWSNKQHGSDRVSSRVDRVFGNFKWMMQWGHVQTEYDLPLISDRSPMMISIIVAAKDGKIPLRFLNVWAEYASFFQ